MLQLNYKQKGFQRKLDAFCDTAPDQKIAQAVAEIIADVRDRGDAAVVYYTDKFDHAKLAPQALRVAPKILRQAAKRLSPEIRSAIDEAGKNIRAFHQKTLPKTWTARNAHGARVGEIFHPLNRCGIYIPGGEAPLVSSVLMSGILAQLAGVPQIAAFTPPQPDGRPNSAICAALNICGIGEVYAIGGVQAIAAMAFGTETIPAVDKIFGPGNAYVCEAKRQVFGHVGVDLLPGPSEVMVIADDSARPEWVAASLLAQAEHGTGREKLYLLALDSKLVNAVIGAAKEQLATLPRAGKMRPVVERNLCAIIVPDLSRAAEVANRIAPEHLELQVAPGEVAVLLKQITTAGAIFAGHYTPTVLGDFTAGPSHTLPTGRTGRFFSGLQVTDFMRRTSLVEYSPASLKKAAATVTTFSALEGLDAHARSLAVRLEG
ncbi:MAG: histidinol dehydrogenase [Puniceicoccales bacterium]|jgi:histidinol dehydrogenase|nr:histidinol dehydrogenase [Puniceicoccales bacterium]